MADAPKIVASGDDGRVDLRNEHGRFWAFFPADTPSRIPGILNAPWKVNSDRTALIHGPYNSFLMANAARLIEVRSGLHTGEIELTSSDAKGIAVHVAARIAGLAHGGEVLASQTVRDLVAGSNLHFVDRGPHSLKGLPEEVRLFAVAR
jgi:hypothetical protein